MNGWARPVLDGDNNMLLSSVEEGLTVRLITTFEPYCCDADDDLEEVVGREELREFDYVPVKDKDEIVGLLHRSEHDTKDAAGQVREAMCSLRGDLIISADAGILSYIERRERAPMPTGPRRESAQRHRDPIRPPEASSAAGHLLAHNTPRAVDV